MYLSRLSPRYAMSSTPDCHRENDLYMELSSPRVKMNIPHTCEPFTASCTSRFSLSIRYSRYNWMGVLVLHRGNFVPDHEQSTHPENTVPQVVRVAGPGVWGLADYDVVWSL